MEESYITIKSSADDFFIEKKSKFIGYVTPCSTQEEAVEFIEKIKSKHWDATHNVYAYVLRQGNIKRYSDDGEPQGTAGIPVLSVIEKAGLTDCCIVVTRYFGGTLLGTGGLVRAYSHGASIAVAAGGTVKRAMCSHLSVKCDYYFYGKLSPMVSEAGGVIEDTVFADDVTLYFRLPNTDVERFSASLTQASFGKYSCEKLGEEFADIDI